MNHTIEQPTAEQVAFEKAARIMCAKIETDPEDLVPAQPPAFAVIAANVVYVRYFWTVVADDMVQLSQMLASLREAAADKAVH